MPCIYHPNQGGTVTAVCWTVPTAPPSNPLIGSNPGLLTSTGGLMGGGGLLLTPAFNLTTGRSLIINHDPTNFNCEEDSEYDYRQEANYGQFPGEGRSATFHLVILKYRELGVAQFSVNITVFNQAPDGGNFKTIQIPVNITKRKACCFPDGRIHTRRLTPPKGAFQGERPQVSITRDGNSGPISITKLILCGNADEMAQQ